MSPEAGQPVKGAVAAVSLNEVKAFLRLDGADEDALLAGLVRTASGLCEAFTGQVLIQREVEVGLPADGEWHRLAVTPVLRLVSARGVDASGAEIVLADGDVDLQIDFCGDGWARVARQDATRAVLGVEAGLAADWNGLPEAVRQGIVRLVAHLFTHRDAAGNTGNSGGPPAAIAALWRPWRRMRLS